MTTISTTSGRVSSRYLTALIRTLDEAWVEKLRKDFLVLMKNLSRVKDYDTGDELRRAFTKYRENFNKWTYAEFLNPAKEEHHRFEGLRKPAWDFYIEINLPLMRADEHYSKEARFAQYEREVKTWEPRVKRKAQVLWKEFKQLLGFQTNQRVDVTLPEQDRLVLEGFQVEMIGFENGDSWQREALAQFKEALRRYRRKASQVLPWLLQKQLPLIAAFEGKLDEGGHYSGDHIYVALSSIASAGPDWGVHVLAHEMGHHLYKHLDSSAQLYWDTAIHQDYGPLDVQSVLAEWPSSVSYTHSFAASLQEKDPVLSLQLDVLSRERGGNVGWERREDFESALNKGTAKVAVPKHPITGYAGKNTEESFCEAVASLVAYGPRTVDPLVRSWLAVVIPGKVKTAEQVAHRVAQRYLAVS